MTNKKRKIKYKNVLKEQNKKLSKKKLRVNTAYFLSHANEKEIYNYNSCDLYGKEKVVNNYVRSLQNDL